MTAGSGAAVSLEPAATTSGDTDALELVLTLCRLLDAERITYCHWKSNESLDRSAAGDNDLDLLVARRDSQRFEEILARLAFKDVVLPAWKELPGVAHWYGLDERSGTLVHVHAHYQLVIGDDMTKNVHLPIEDAYLASSVPRHPFMVPAPEFELGLFLVRMVLKHCAWDAIAMSQGSLSASERRELQQLTAETDPERFRATVQRELPCIDRTLWERCLRSVRPGSSIWFRVWTESRLSGVLAACSRRSRASNTALKVWRRVRSTARRRVLRRGPVCKRLGAGGALIGVVGGDGAGKSTVVEDLSRWLGAEILTTTVHLGKPTRSWSSRVVRGSMKAAASVRRSPTSSGAALRSSLSADDDAPLTVRSKARLVWETLTARDRYRAYRRARRAASNGAIVVCDRFPLPEIRLMDGAVTAATADPSRRGRWFQVLSGLERRYYGRIAAPDILLRVDPDLAVQRKREEPESFVRPRSEEIWRTDWRSTPAVVIDSGRPRDEVLSRVRSAVWSRL